MALTLQRYIGETIVVEGLYLITLRSIRFGSSGAMASISVFNEKTGSTVWLDFTHIGKSIIIEDGFQLNLVRVNGQRSATIGCIADRRFVFARVERKTGPGRHDSLVTHRTTKWEFLSVLKTI